MIYILTKTRNVPRLMEDHERFQPRSSDEPTTIAKSLGLTHRLTFVPGDAVKTIPGFVANNRGLRLSLLHLDFDVYEPTKAALEHLFSLARTRRNSGP